jgi:fructokinase
MDIVCLGELLVDMFPAEVGVSLVEVSAFHPKPGGAPANVAVAASKLGARSAFIGKLGDDAFGYHLADILAKEGVDVRGVRFDENARTSMAFIALPDKNTADFVFYRNPGADMLLKPEELDRDLLGDTRAFHFGSISLIDEPSRSATLEALKISQEAGALISFDVNYRPRLWKSPEQAVERIMATIPRANLIKVNDVELALLTNCDDLTEGGQKLLALGPQICVVTLGPKGSYFQIAQGGEHIAPFEVDAVDATGCGDAFVAGLLLQLVLDHDWRNNLTLDRMREILRYANAVGAITALSLGVIPALPTADQVRRFLSEHQEGRTPK